MQLLQFEGSSKRLSIPLATCGISCSRGLPPARGLQLLQVQSSRERSSLFIFPTWYIPFKRGLLSGRGLQMQMFEGFSEHPKTLFHTCSVSRTRSLLWSRGMQMQMLEGLSEHSKHSFTHVAYLAHEAYFGVEGSSCCSLRA